MPSYVLSGTGVQALSPGTTQVLVRVMTAPGGSSFGSANPSNRYGVGLLRFGDGVSFDEPVPVIGGPQRVVMPAPASVVGYNVFGDGIIEIEETVGSSPSVFSTLDGTSTFIGSAIQVSWNNPGAVFDDWITVQRTTEPLDALNRYLGADGWMRINSCSTVSGSSPSINGTCTSTITMPTGGQFEVRLYHDNPLAFIARGAQFTVG